MKRIVFGLFCVAALFARADAASPLPTASPSPTAATSSSPTAAPIVPPRDAPALRSTTPPLGPTNAPIPPPPPDNVWLGSSTTIGLPLMLHGDRPYIQALIDGHPSVLIVDTGALDTMIDASILGDSGKTTVSLQIGDLRFPKLRVVRSDVEGYTQQYLGAGADGIIGRDLLSHYPVAFDFPGRVITVFRDSKSAAAVQPPGAVSLTLRLIGGLPTIAGSLDGQQNRWFAFSTGVNPQIQLQPSQARAYGVSRGERTIPYQEPAISGTMTGMLVRARSLSLGTLTFNQPLVALLDGTHSVQPELAGVLGQMILSRLSFLIDESSQSAFISAPAGSTAARLYDPSGITLEMHRDVIVVRSVVPGTPADAHLRPGDEIVSINGLVPATLDFARQLLDGNPGTKITIAYRRWHLVHSATLTLHVII